MFFIGMRVDLWKVRLETFQVVVEQQHVLTVTKELDKGQYLGTLENGEEYLFFNDHWWSQLKKGEFRFEMAYAVWNKHLANPKTKMRIIDLSNGEEIVPTGNLYKCQKHSRYYLELHKCFACSVEKRKLA